MELVISKMQFVIINYVIRTENFKVEYGVIFTRLVTNINIAIELFLCYIAKVLSFVFVSMAIYF